MKILFTGGHLSPALALIDSLINKPNVKTVFVGRRYNNDQEKSLSLEFKEIEKRKIKFYHLATGRLTRIFNFNTLFNILKIPLGFLTALKIIYQEKPDIIFTFGGYIAFPIALSALIFGIPLYTHEQTIKPGLANRIIALIAKKVFISFEETKKFFPKDKTIYTGIPLKQSIFQSIKKPISFKGIKKPKIFVMGGSLGSHSINLLIEKILSQLKKNYFVIHQVGNIRKYHDFERLKKMADKDYYVTDHFFDDEIGYIYRNADLVISRAGANTFFELIALKKPAVLVPLPWSANNEQLNQAQLFEKLGLGSFFNQDEKPEKLLAVIKKIFSNYQIYKKNFDCLPIKFYQNATEKIIKYLL